MAQLRSEVAATRPPRGADAGPAQPGPGRPGRRPRPHPLLSSVLAGLALLPIAAAAARAVARDWLPIGDNAFFAIRARDVLTADPPLLGTWTSASLTSGGDLNNPGPLLFDALALPTTLVPGGTGLAIGAALVNGMAVAGAILFAHRRGGPLLAAAAALVAAALGWAMGSELLFDPWQPHSLLLPFLCFLVLVWSCTRGDLAALPLTVLAGSYVVQSHLSYGYLVPLLSAWAVAGLALDLRARRRADRGGWSDRRRRAGRAAVVAVVVAVGCWVQPLIEELTGEGEGNLSRLAGVLGDGAVTTTGARIGARLLASVLALPPWWLRSSFGDAFLPASDVPDVGFIAPEDLDIPSSATALAGLAALVLVLLGCGLAARRHRDVESGAALATAAVAVVAGLVTASRMPIGAVGIAPHQFRWLWPLGAFVAFSVVAALLRWAAASAPARMPPIAVGVGLLTGIVALLNLPANNQRTGPSADAWAIPPARAISAQLGGVEWEGPVLVETRDIRAFDPYTVAVMAELQRQDVAFVVEDPGMVRQLGPARRFRGDNARSVLYERAGDATRTAPAGTERVALHEGLDGGEQRELAELETAVLDHLDEAGEVPLNERGDAALARGELPGLEAQAGGPLDAEALLGSRELVVLVRADLLRLDSAWTDRFERWADLQFRWDRETVAVFVGPFDGPARPAG